MCFPMRFLNRWQISVIKEQEGGPRWCVSSRLCQQQGGWTEKISDSREKNWRTSQCKEQPGEQWPVCGKQSPNPLIFVWYGDQHFIWGRIWGVCTFKSIKRLAVLLQRLRPIDRCPKRRGILTWRFSCREVDTVNCLYLVKLQSRGSQTVIGPQGNHSEISRMRKFKDLQSVFHNCPHMSFPYSTQKIRLNLFFSKILMN